MSALSLVLKGTVRAFGTTLRNLFRKPITEKYPRAPRPIPTRWRGGTFALTLDPETREENCIGCRLCEYICPSQIISVKLRKGEPRTNGKGATYAESFVLNFQACMQCELCVQVCPTDAIVMVRSLHAAAGSRDDLVLTKERLIQNGVRLLEQPELQSETTGNRIRAWMSAQPAEEASS